MTRLDLTKLNQTRFLFLDFDGVLNRIVSGGYQPPHPRIDPELAARVARCADDWDLNVVVSSSWREDHSLDGLRDIILAAGVPTLAARLVGATPVYEKVPKQKYLRAFEVRDWLVKHALPQTPYAIVDDAARHNFPAERFVHVDGKAGFTDANALRVNDIFQLDSGV